MKNLLHDIDEVLLMGPGPSCIPGEVYKALSCKTLGHMDYYFIQIMDEIKNHLKELLRTKNLLTLPVSGTGSAGMETCFVNLIERGDRVLILINGVFGKRMADVAQRCGADTSTIEIEWGKAFTSEQIADALEKKPAKVVGIVHAETSTGVCQPLEEISRIVHDNGALFLVDTVTSLGGMKVDVDGRQIDACYSGTQKCLSCPPGLSPVTFNDAAVNVIENRKVKVRSWYLDVSMIRKYWGSERLYHHTAPINMNYALLEALKIVKEEGLKQ